jgi:hypothetical protein
MRQHHASGQQYAWPLLRKLQCAWSGPASLFAFFTAAACFCCGLLLHGEKYSKNNIVSEAYYQSIFMFPHL